MTCTGYMKTRGKPPLVCAGDCELSLSLHHPIPVDPAKARSPDKHVWRMPEAERRAQRPPWWRARSDRERRPTRAASARPQFHTAHKFPERACWPGCLPSLHMSDVRTRLGQRTHCSYRTLHRRLRGDALYTCNQEELVAWARWPAAHSELQLDGDGSLASALEQAKERCERDCVSILRCIGTTLLHRKTLRKTGRQHLAPPPRRSDPLSIVAGAQTHASSLCRYIRTLKMFAIYVGGGIR